MPSNNVKLLLVASALNLGITSSLFWQLQKVSKMEQIQQEKIDDISPPYDLIKAIIKVESGGNPGAYNKYSGAVGLMQLTPIVYNKICGLSKEEAFEPEKNVACGAMYIQHLLKRFGGNVEKTLMFYNGGGKMVNKSYAKKVLND